MYHGDYSAAAGVVGRTRDRRDWSRLSIPVLLTIGNRVPRHPIVWLRVNFVILLLVIFMASVARYIRLSLLDQAES